ncbi:MAG: hypothetical protein KDC87_18345, partial [Planctomycetes bacterium]|nr:hypothetical protein [Planctomycetota bacterium]
MSSGERPTGIPSDVEDRVLEVLDRTEPGGERQAAIDALGLPPEVRQAVQRWLDEAETDDGPEEPPILPVRSTSPRPTPAKLPRRMGELELRSVLGRGGMGVV